MTLAILLSKKKRSTSKRSYHPLEKSTLGRLPFTENLTTSHAPKHKLSPQ
jgi:hypothetical protein